VASLQVDNGESAESEPDLPGNKKAFVVWTAMPDSIRHRLHQSRRNPVLTIEIKFPANTAHKALDSGKYLTLNRPLFQT
jgi:hypothetical protein